MGRQPQLNAVSHFMNLRLLLVFFLAQIGDMPGQTDAAGNAAPPVDRPGHDAVLKVMERVADWQLAHPSPHSSTDWTQAAGYTGMMALAEISPSPRFLDAMVKMAEGNAWKLGPRPYHADDQCVGQTYTELYFRFKDPSMIAPMREQFDRVLTHPKDGSLDFDGQRNPDRLDRWSWCDSLFMAPPAWIRLSAATGNRAYLDFAVEHWWKTSDFLFDRNEHLFFRDSSYFARREANGRKVFWSRGNGWVMAGLVRVMQYLPASHPARPRFIEQYRAMADKILSCQQPDGLWSASLLDPGDYPLKETSGSCFFCYALAWGINDGFLDRARFEPAVADAWRGLVDCVSEDGRLTHVQPIGADPKKFDEGSTEIYGVGAFLLAGSEVCHLRQGAEKTATGQTQQPEKKQ
jgi:rhamnogalacturonyl hydrolase YesR